MRAKPMLSVVIPAGNSERPLVATLAALVPGSTAGLIAEVIVAHAGTDGRIADVADFAGCRLVAVPGPAGARMRAGAGMARAPWLMFIEPGVVPDPAWIGEVGAFIAAAERAGMANARAAIFRPATAAGHTRSHFGEVIALLRASLGATPRPDQGLIITRQRYDQIGGHRPDHPDCRADLFRRLGRRRTVMLRCGAISRENDGS